MTTTTESTPLQSAIASIREVDSLDDLQSIQAEIKARWNLIRKRAVRSIEVGTRVSFDLKNGKTVIGHVEKRNRKTVRVIGETVDGEPVSEFHGGWNVSPSLLTVLD